MVRFVSNASQVVCIINMSIVRRLVAWLLVCFSYFFLNANYQSVGSRSLIICNWKISSTRTECSSKILISPDSGSLVVVPTLILGVTTAARAGSRRGSCWGLRIFIIQRICLLYTRSI